MKRKYFWHNLTVEEIVDILKTNKEQGLSSAQAKTLLQRYGINVLPTKKKFSIFLLFISQFNNILIYILIAAAVISFLLQDFVDAWIIVIAIIINVIVGFIQEYKAQTALEKLSQVIENYCIVIRDGQKKEINTKELVPGDIIILQAGSNVPADCRLFYVKDFEVNEATLTGESLPVSKNIKVLKQKNIVLAQRKNMVFMGTTVVSGTAKAIVVSTGKQTQIGKIASLIKQTKEELTPLQVKLELFSKTLGYFILGLSFVIFVVGLLLGKPFVEMFTVAVAAAVSAIPEGLVIAVTVILAIGMQRILQKKALVRKLVAAETLGSTDIVCCDKTGTLTQGKMSVFALLTLDRFILLKGRNFSKQKVSFDIKSLLEIGILANKAFVDKKAKTRSKKILGTPTEQALLEVGLNFGFNKEELLKKYKFLDEQPFNSIKKYTLSLHCKNNKENILFIDGAPEKVLKVSKFVLKGRKIVKLEKDLRQWFIDEQKKYSSQGMRIVGAGYKIVDSKKSFISKELVRDFVFVGFFIIKDPIRKGVRTTIQKAKQAGISVVMITGDHKNTALSIAKDLGLDIKKQVLDGNDLLKMSDLELKNKVQNVSVFARVTPEDKLRIVDAFQENGHVVAMTGDGVNDAPALKRADIGIAVGAGSDVTKGVADMVLLDNNFKTIIAAIKQGRIIVDNIKKVIVYLLSDSFTAMVLVFGSLLLGLPLPLTAGQILWINLISDGFPYMALTLEKGSDDIMKLKPRKKTENILDREMKVLIFFVGIIIDVILFALFWYYLNVVGNLAHARTIIFAALGFDVLIYSFSCKNLRKPLWKINIFDNKYLNIAVILGFMIQLSALYIPSLRNLLRVDVIYFTDWLVIIPLAFLKILGIEIVKYWFIHKRAFN